MSRFRSSAQVRWPHHGTKQTVKLRYSYADHRFIRALYEQLRLYTWHAALPPNRAEASIEIPKNPGSEPYRRAVSGSQGYS